MKRDNLIPNFKTQTPTMAARVGLCAGPPTQAKLFKKSVALLILLLIIDTAGFTQQKFSGRVTGIGDEPLVGASVLVKSSQQGTTADADGNFTITAKPGDILVISSVGYLSKEIQLGAETSLQIALTPLLTDLDEVVVTGYIAERKREITGAVSVVHVKEMRQSPVGTGEEALQGWVSGLTIITSGQPGGASDIRVRGITAFGNNAPLIIVDDVRGDLHDININDIESIQVLKDASAAIYGVAGSNGVIIITTKKGKKGRPRVSYDFYYGVTTPGHGYDMANPEEQANAIWLQQRNSGIANPSNKQYGNGSDPVIPDYIQTLPWVDSNTGETINYGYTLCNCPRDSIVDPKYYDINTAQITGANKSGTNWYDVITRNAATMSHNISVSSGSEKSSYFFSANYLDQQGIAKFQYLKRYSVRANTQFTIKDKIRIGENAYVFYKQNPTFANQNGGSPFFNAFLEYAIIPVYDIAGNFAGTKSQDLGNASNPYAGMYRTKDNKVYNWNIAGNVYAEVDFLKHFTARTNFGGVVDNTYGFNFNFVPYENHEGNTGDNSFDEYAGYSTEWTFNNTLTYNNAFRKHNVKVLLGTEAVDYYGRNLHATRSVYFSEDPDYWILDNGTSVQSNEGGAYETSLWSQFARLEYAYNGKYLINGSIRRDGSSVFASDVRHGYFPAFSAGWIISRENFFKSVPFVDNLKVRVSWGKLGSTSNVQPTNAFDLYASSLGHSSYDLAGSSTRPFAGFYRSNLGNPATTWEGDIISNIGLDATIMKNHLDFSLEWYKKKISGLLFEQKGPAANVVFVGDPLRPVVNLGDMHNTGIDFNITYHGNIGNDLKFDVNGSLTSYNNKIVDIPGLSYFDGPEMWSISPVHNQEGHPVGAFYGYKVIGLFQSDEDVLKSPYQPGAAPGLFKYQDINHNDTIDDNDRTFIGDPNPDFTYGLNISFTFKNFDFSAFFFGSKGNDIFDVTKLFTDFPDYQTATKKEVAINSWTPENTNTTIPKFVTVGGFSTHGVANSYFISKGSYLRAKQMQVGYTFPSKMLSRTRIDRLRIYVQVANLFTITKYRGLDPELQSSVIDDNTGHGDKTVYGIDQGNYPHTPAYFVGINLNF